MGYLNLRECIADLELHGQLKRVDCEVDPNLEIGAIQRRVYRAGGPALLFTNVKGCRFPMLGNLYGTIERMRFLFRDTLEAISGLCRIRSEPSVLLKNPAAYLGIPFHLLHLFPKMTSGGAVAAHRTSVDRLPQLKTWPQDGGAFITLPQVYTESPLHPGWRQSNLGMYRVQISGGGYSNEEIGIHYQIHRGISIHHAEAIEREVPLQVNISVGGSPALAVAAVMPLPHGVPELAFAGLLGGRRVRMFSNGGGLPIPAEADFCISGEIVRGKTLTEGPFGDHLGYYSLRHEFPVLKVREVLHREGAVWPFTTVGRPPQEDSVFGRFIHEITGPLVPDLIPGVEAVHAVDAAGVHPLLLAVGSERYEPYGTERRPMELLTLANAILGQGQLSLAKYLLIAAREDAPDVDVLDQEGFFRHVLERVDWRRDLHFQTCTTIDTLDYSGAGLNRGSKVVIAAAGPTRRSLPVTVPAGLRLPSGFSAPTVCLPGVLAVRGPACAEGPGDPAADIERFCAFFTAESEISAFPLIVVVDDADFTSRTLDNFLWVTFTRSNPAVDIHGIGSFCTQKHWGCRGALVIDARSKPHHAPPIVDDPEVERRVDQLGAKGGPLHGMV